MASMLMAMIRRVREARRIMRMSREQLEAMKLEKFRRLARHVRERSPYYARIIQDRGIEVDRCVPADFPVLTKSDVMANFDRIVTDRRITKAGVAAFLTRSVDPNELLFNEYRVLHTSGSSGEVGYFLYAGNEWIIGMTQGFGHRRDRVEAPRRRRRFGRRRIAYYAAVGGHFAGVSMMSSTQSGIGRLFAKVELFEINSPLGEIIERLNAYQPDMLSGYTAGLKILADKQREGVLRIAPRALATGGEAMTPADRAMLESAFGCPAASAYGCTEHLMMGAVNPDGQTMTLFDDDLIYEIFDDHSLVTNLFNFTLPLIRYRMSDILRPVRQPNSTSPHLIVNSLVGRTEKMPKFVNRDGIEDFIHPISVVELFIPGVTRFQMQLVDKTSFRFAVVLDKALDASAREVAIAAAQRRLRDLLDQKLMQNVVFAVTPVEEIPTDPKTRKFKLIVDAA